MQALYETWLHRGGQARPLRALQHQQAQAISQHLIVQLLPPGLGRVASALSIDGHIESIARGVIDLRDVLYFVTVSAGCLLVAQASLESRRWR